MFPLILAALFPGVQLLASIAASLLVDGVFDQPLADEIQARAEYLLAVTGISQLFALAVIAAVAAAVGLWTPRFDRRRASRAISVTGPVIVLTLGAQMVQGSVLSLFDAELGDYARIAELVLEANLAVVIVTVAFVAGICEEFVFRGIIQPITVHALGPVFGIAFTALLFGMVHLIPVQIGAGIIFGLVFGYIRYRSDSVLPAIIAHVTANGIVAVLGHTASGVSATPANLTTEIASTGLLITVLSTGVLAASLGVVWFETVIRRRRAG